MVTDAMFEGVRMFLTYKCSYEMISGIVSCSVSLVKMEFSVA